MKPTKTENSASQKAPPAKSRHSLGKVADLRQRLLALLKHETHGNVVLVDKAFKRLVQIVFEALPGRPALETIEQSMIDLLGAVPDDVQLEEMAWRLAGNTRRLTQGRAVPAWRVQVMAEWVPLQILWARREPNRRGNPGALFGFRVLAGTPAGKLIERWLSRKQCYIVARQMGFTYPRGDNDGLPYAAPEEFVRLRLLGLVLPELCRDGPQFQDIQVSPTLLAWNKEILKRRARVHPKFRCQKDLPASFPCWKCPIGFLQCAAGTHRLNWKVQECSKCKKRAMVDPERTDGACVDCCWNASRGESR